MKNQQNVDELQVGILEIADIIKEEIALIMEFTKLAIIGNGFDLSHGYKTTFKDFIESKSEDKSIKSFKEFINKNYDNDELSWYEFESIADDVTLKWFLDVNFPDIQHDSNNLLEKEDINT